MSPPPTGSWTAQQARNLLMARWLRSGAYAAVLVLIVARASVEQVADNPAIASHLSSSNGV